jgi:hypothetical protein
MGKGEDKKMGEMGEMREVGKMGKIGRGVLQVS